MLQSPSSALTTIETDDSIEYLSPVANLLRHLILTRFHETARWDLIITSFALTQSGQRYMRGIGNRCDPPITEDFSDDDDNDSEDEDL